MQLEQLAEERDEAQHLVALDAVPHARPTPQEERAEVGELRDARRVADGLREPRVPVAPKTSGAEALAPLRQALQALLGVVEARQENRLAVYPALRVAMSRALKCRALENRPPLLKN